MCQYFDIEKALKVNISHVFVFTSHFSSVTLLFALSSCLKAIRQLQRNGHIPSDASLFKSYAEYGHFVDVRVAALEALVDYTRGRTFITSMQVVVVIISILVKLIDLIGVGPNPQLRCQ